MAAMQFRDDHNTDIADLTGQPALLSVDPEDRPKFLDLNDSVFKSVNSDLLQPNHPGYLNTLPSGP